MIRGRYVGPDQRLYNQRALLMKTTTGWKAQFDDTSLPEAYGWWEFLESEFEVDPS